jgi:hypothetical protein
MLSLLDIRSISIDILGFTPIAVAIAMWAMVGISVGWTGRFVALEKTRGGVPGILLALH